MNKTLRGMVLAISFALPGPSSAQSFPCAIAGQLQCDAHTAPQPVQKPVGKEEAMGLFLKGMNLGDIALTDEQRRQILSIIQSQSAEVVDRIQTIQSAHAFLREMAISKRFDGNLANALTKAIAENSADLALLQAEREYQVYALLTQEQLRQLRLDKIGS